MKKILPGVMIVLVICVFTLSAGEPVVIVNKDNAIAEISKGDVEKIYLGKKSEWPDGGKILPCDQKFEARVAEAFIQDLVNKSVADYQAYWMEKMLSGAANPPKSLANDQEVTDYVAKTKGAIGYVDSGSPLVDGVKKVTVK